MITTVLTSRQKSSKKYRTSPKGKAAVKRANTVYNLKHPEIRVAHNTINHAVRNGSVPKPTDLNCHFCSKQGREYHHKDYSKPLDVTSVCTDCHNILTFKTVCIASMFANMGGLPITHRVRNDHNVYLTSIN